MARPPKERLRELSDGAELAHALSEAPEVVPEVADTFGHRWSDWGYTEEDATRFGWPVRMLLVWDNLTWHYTADLVVWCHQQVIALLYTPIGGSWLNMAESVQRILVRRALSGQHPQSAQEIIAWLEATGRGWNARPTPFVWGGKRAQRRKRWRDRHPLGGSFACTRTPVPRRKPVCAATQDQCHSAAQVTH